MLLSSNLHFRTQVVTHAKNPFFSRNFALLCIVLASVYNLGEQGLRSNTMNTDCEEETSKFFTTVYGQFVKDLCYSECSDFEAPVKIFMATFFPDGVTKPFQEEVSNIYHILIYKCLLI